MTLHRPYIGSSDVPAILGLTAWKSEFAVWARLMGLPYEDKRDPLMDLGNMVEPGLLRWYAERERVPVYRGPAVTQAPIRHPEGWLAVHHDGYTPARGGWVIEAKVIPTFDGEWGEDGTPNARTDYLVQTETQVEVLASAGWPMAGGVVVAISRMSGEKRCYPFERDPVSGAELVATLRAWWTRHIVNGERPAYDDSPEARAWALGRYNPARNTERAASLTEEAMVARYAQDGRTIKAQTADRQTLAAEILARMDTRTMVLANGARVVRTSNGQLRIYGLED